MLGVYCVTRRIQDACMRSFTSTRLWMKTKTLFFSRVDVNIRRVNGKRHGANVREYPPPPLFVWRSLHSLHNVNGRMRGVCVSSSASR